MRGVVAGGLISCIDVEHIQTSTTLGPAQCRDQRAEGGVTICKSG